MRYSLLNLCASIRKLPFAYSIIVEQFMQNIRCQLHPTEPITNFCKKPQCLIELCASCICLHTEMHARNHTVPTYENIQKTYQNASAAVDEQRALIEKEKNLILSFNNNWDQRKERVFVVLDLAKRDVIDLVHKTFDELHRDYEKKIVDLEIVMQNKGGQRIRNLVNSHNKESQKLFNYQQDLATWKGPQTVKRLYIETLPKSKDLLRAIRDDFDHLNRHQLNLDLLPSNLADLKVSILKCLSFEVVYPTAMIYQSREIAKPEFIHSCTNFYQRPKSCGKSIPGSVLYVDGNSQIEVGSGSKSKLLVTTASTRFSETPNSANNGKSLLRTSKKPNIFSNSRASTQIRA